MKRRDFGKRPRGPNGKCGQLHGYMETGGEKRSGRRGRPGTVLKESLVFLYRLGLLSGVKKEKTDSATDPGYGTVGKIEGKLKLGLAPGRLGEWVKVTGSEHSIVLSVVGGREVGARSSICR